MAGATAAGTSGDVVSAGIPLELVASPEPAGTPGVVLAGTTPEPTADMLGGALACTTTDVAAGAADAVPLGAVTASELTPGAVPITVPTLRSDGFGCGTIANSAALQSPAILAATEVGS